NYLASVRSFAEFGNKAPPHRRSLAKRFRSDLLSEWHKPVHQYHANALYAQNRLSYFEHHRHSFPKEVMFSDDVITNADKLFWFTCC
ncbi:hypothetical protein, partial [Vibrio jasicida]|uniref:hypothetical protein n=1 Tax=Vibrio jasicida TaxID=766224 RepID=UPI001E5303AA